MSDERPDYTDRMFERTAEVIRAWVKESLDADARDHRALDSAASPTKGTS